MGRSGNLLATNDKYIPILLADPHYDVRADGTIWTNICETGKVSVSNTWRQAGSLHDGYVVLKCTFEGVHVSLTAHRIVYQKFVGQLSEDLIVNHKNGVRDCNEPQNLELITQGANVEHRFRVLGRAPVIGNAKISDEIADQIRNDHATGLSYKELRKKYGIAKSSISYLINKKTWNRKIESNHEFSYKPKLTMEIANEIRTLYKNGEKQKILAKTYNLGLTTIKNVCANRIWVV